MSFDRFRIQTAIEIDLGCLDINQWSSYKNQFEKFEINSSRKITLEPKLKKDAADLYFKGIYSLTDAIYCISQGRHSWSVVKIYYAVFYLLRCSLATKSIAFIKNRGIYTIELKIGKKPVKRDTGKYKSQDIRGDHKTTIATYVQLVGDSDILQTNTINGILFYDWLMNLREQINYRERIFHEPDQRYFYASLFDKKTARNQIETYIEDDSFVYCFDEDHCCLAAPLKLAINVQEELRNFIEFEPFDNLKKHEIKKLIKVLDLDQSNIFQPLLEF
jgi:uncharacterized protein (UPF0332 family)